MQIFDDEPFIDTIDYIFVSSKVQVLACKSLLDRSLLLAYMYCHCFCC